MTRADLKKGVGDPLRKQQFGARGSSWFRTTPDVIQVVNLQKSRFGDQFYLNMALWPRQISGPEFPSENKCQVRARVATFVPPIAKLINNQIFNLDSALACDVRAVAIARLMTAVVLPFFNLSSDLEWMRVHYAAGQFRGMWILADQLGWPATTQNQPTENDISFFVHKADMEMFATLEGQSR